MNRFGRPGEVAAGQSLAPLHVFERIELRRDRVRLPIWALAVAGLVLESDAVLAEVQSLLNRTVGRRVPGASGSAAANL